MTTTKPLFSNATEWERWTARNCERCIKHSRPKGDEYTAFRCAVDRDIQAQSAGIHEVSERSHDTVAFQYCPYKQTSRKPHKKRKIKGQGEIEF